jgi:CheY-like chemotaxis protein
MAFDSLTQARQLFLAEAQELCQQVKEGLLILVHAPTPLTYQKLVRRVQTLCQGAHSLELTDIELWADGLGMLLEAHAESAGQGSVVHELLHHLCDGLQLSLITHSSVTDAPTALSQREFVLHSLVPKVLEVFEVVSTQTLSAPLQSRLLQQQVQWIQFWSQSLSLSALKNISDATLTAFEAFPESIIAIAPITLAGFQVAYEATIQGIATPQPLLQHSPYLPEKALDVFHTEQHLVGLAHQIIFCVATESIEEIAVLDPSQLQYQDGCAQILWRDRLLPLHPLIDLWKPSAASTAPSAPIQTSSMMLVLTHESQTLAVSVDVDRLIVEPELKLNRVDSASTLQCCYGIATLGEVSGMEVVDVNCLLREWLSADVSSERLVNRAQGTAPELIASAVRAFSLAQAATPSKSKTILIVDDSKTVRELLTLTLREAGYSVLQAQDGQQALEHLQHQIEIHLILCDLEMSNLNGFEFLRHRLQDPRWIQIPVLILSSHTGDEYRQLSKKLGAADYFTIPYDRATLLQGIENLLHQSQA